MKLSFLTLRNLATLIILLIFPFNVFGFKYVLTPSPLIFSKQILTNSDTCPTGLEMNIWPIGRNHGLDWSNGSPNVIAGFDNLIYEGHTSYCYPDGNLAIYTEGFKVYNGQKLPIRFTAAEGVSNSSTTMSCILAQPRHDSIYYVFHMDHSLTHFSDETQFLYYSVYNSNSNLMINRGVLLDTTSEKVTAVRHCNGRDWWIIGMKGVGNAFYSWLLTDTGLVTRPVISFSGNVHVLDTFGYPFWANIGYLKPSHDGALLVEISAGSLSYKDTSWIEIHNFDPSTGQVKFAAEFPRPNFGRQDLYSCEFSPDNRFLYVNGGGLTQYDLNILNSIDIANSIKLFSIPPGTNSVASPVLGPDGKIYLTSFWKNYLHLIPNPNEPYPSCGFIPDFLHVGSKTGLAAPQYPSGLMWPYKAYLRGPSKICRYDTATWYLTDPCNHEKLNWTLPDGGTLIRNDDTLQAYFSDEGKYRITVSYSIPCGYKTDTLNIIVGRCHCPTDFRWLQKDTLICKGTSAHLSFMPGGWEENNQSGLDTVHLNLIPLYHDTLIQLNFYTKDGCDTLVQFQIKIQPEPSTIKQHRICKGDSIMLFGSWHKEDTTLIFQGMSSSGCDSTHQITIQVVSPSYGRKLWPICPGDSILHQNNWFKTDTILFSQHQSYLGCDSLHQDEIRVGGTDSTLLNFRICQGDSVLINGLVYKDNNQWINRLTSSRGCDDSLVLFEVKILDHSVTIRDSLNLCEGDSIQIDGSWFYTDTLIRHEYSNMHGCDSVREWRIKLLNEIPETRDTLYFCKGDSILIAGIYYSSEQDIFLSNSAINGCDSLSILTLREYAFQEPQERIMRLCYGDSLLIDGRYYRSDTLIQTRHFNRFGCDSLIHWIVSTYPEIPSNTINHNICPGDSVFINGIWYRDSLILKQNYTSAVNGCDSLVFHNIIILAAPEIRYNIQSCPGDTIHLNGKVYTTDANFSVRMPSPFGCDSLFHYNIRFHREQDAGLPDVLEVEEGQSFKLTPWIAPNIKSIRWYPVQGLSCTNCPEPSIAVSAETKYYIETTDEFGCIHLDSVLILVKKIDSQIHIPNAFSPNGDNINDIWMPVFSDTQGKVISLSIYDRWGNEVFNCNDNVLTQCGWNGMIDGKMCLPGVYVFQIYSQDQKGIFKRVTGNITLLR